MPGKTRPNAPDNACVETSSMMRQKQEQDQLRQTPRRRYRYPPEEKIRNSQKTCHIRNAIREYVGWVKDTFLPRTDSNTIWRPRDSENRELYLHWEEEKESHSSKIWTKRTYKHHTRKSETRKIEDKTDRLQKQASKTCDQSGNTQDSYALLRAHET